MQPETVRRNASGWLSCQGTRRTAQSEQAGGGKLGISSLTTIKPMHDKRLESHWKSQVRVEFTILSARRRPRNSRKWVLNQADKISIIGQSQLEWEDGWDSWENSCQGGFKWSGPLPNKKYAGWNWVNSCTNGSSRGNYWATRRRVASELSTHKLFD